MKRMMSTDEYCVRAFLLFLLIGVHHASSRPILSEIPNLVELLDEIKNDLPACNTTTVIELNEYRESELITSPNYPLYYPSDIELCWTILSDGGYITFWIENVHVEKYDFLRFYDGDRATRNTLMTRVDSVDHSIERVTSGPAAHLAITTDSNTQYAGFRICVCRSSVSNCAEACDVSQLRPVYIYSLIFLGVLLFSGFIGGTATVTWYMLSYKNAEELASRAARRSEPDAQIVDSASVAPEPWTAPAEPEPVVEPVRHARRSSRRSSMIPSLGAVAENGADENAENSTAESTEATRDSDVGKVQTRQHTAPIPRGFSVDLFR